MSPMAPAMFADDDTCTVPPFTCAALLLTTSLTRRLRLVPALEEAVIEPPVPPVPVAFARPEPPRPTVLPATALPALPPFAVALTVRSPPPAPVAVATAFPPFPLVRPAPLPVPP